MAAAQYNIIGANYASMEDLPSEQVATALLKSKLEELPRNLRVLDLACGTGTYAQAALSLGVAKEVVGVDISSAMVEVGQVWEERVSPGAPRIEFHVADCMEPLDHLGFEPGSFDLVMGNYLFNYSSTRKQLVAMWRNVATYLKPGGKFIGLLPTFDVQAHVKRDSWNGMTYQKLEQLEESTKVHLTAHCKPKVEFDNYVLPQRDYEEAPLEVGMTDVIFYPPTEVHLPPTEGPAMDKFIAYLANPISVVCRASKAI